MQSEYPTNLRKLLFGRKEMKKQSLLEIICCLLVLLLVYQWFMYFKIRFSNYEPQWQEFEELNDQLVAIEAQCPMYAEFRGMNFLGLSGRLCRNAVAYVPAADGQFPVCEVPATVDRGMLLIAMRGSMIGELFDIRRSMMNIYLYKGRDLISQAIREHFAWEPGNVRLTLNFALRLRPSVTFLDVGSNIGVYSIQAAKVGLPVVSVDANIRNLLRPRLSLDAASLNVTLVWNFISPDQTLKYLSFLADCNVGGAGTDKDLTDSIPVMPIRSEQLCGLIRTRLLVIKMDIEGGEADFLMTPGWMFTRFKVAAVQMEWSPGLMRGNNFVVIRKFFTDRGYRVWQVPWVNPLDPSSDDDSRWEAFMDVLWVRRDFVHVLRRLQLSSELKEA